MQFSTVCVSRNLTEALVGQRYQSFEDTLLFSVAQASVLKNSVIFVYENGGIVYRANLTLLLNAEPDISTSR